MTLFLSSNFSKTCELGTLPGPRKSQKLHLISNMLHKLSCCRSCFPATSSRSNTYFAAVIQYCDPKLAQFTYIIKCHCKVSLDSFIFFQNVQKVLQNRFPKSKSLLQHSPYLFSVCTLAVTSRVPSTSASPYCFVSLKCAGFHNQSGVSKPLVVFLTRWSKGTSHVLKNQSVPVGISRQFIYANICKMALVSKVQGRINKSYSQS